MVPYSSAIWRRSHLGPPNCSTQALNRRSSRATRGFASCDTQATSGDLECEGGDAGAKLRRLLALTSSSVLMTDLAVRDWSRRDPAVAERLRRIDNRRMDYLRSLFRGFCVDADDIEGRCNHSIAADHQSRSRADVLERALRLLET
jgi:hypothetical protein